LSPSINRGDLPALLRSGKSTYGTFLGLGTPLTAEIAAIAGLDWVLLDLEHGASSESDIGDTVVSAGAYGIPTIVRVESNERIRIGRALDAGAAGLMIPRIETVEQVHAVLRCMTYPPKGERGVATYNRSAAWGTDVTGIYAGRESVCIIQIETLGALAKVEEIAAIDGVDVLFVGPLDLSFALGVPQEFKNEKYLEATNRVIAAAQAHGKVAGILAPDADAAQELRDRGFNFVVIGSDSTILTKSISQLVTQLKKSEK
jgi:2-dehydro-3-deoxyglucarate aldolase/4-hydroxy-2-oxoheptanedioate aldolase